MGGSVKVEPLIGKARRSIELADHRINVFEGSVRSGKTVVSLLAWLRFVRTGPAGNLLMVGKTERTLKHNVIDPLIDMLGPSRIRYVQGAGELFILGRRIYLAGANDEKAEGKIRGLTLAGAYVDEASIMPESMWSMLLTRLSIEGARLYATSNPDSPNHWLLKQYLARSVVWVRRDGKVATSDNSEAVDMDLARFSFRLDDNHTLNEAYKASVKATFTGLWYKRFVDGLWVLAEGAIFDMFDPDVGRGHVVDHLPDILDWWVSIDYGTTNPFVATLLGEGADRRMYVAAEWRWDSTVERRQLTDLEYSAMLRRWLDELAARGETKGGAMWAGCARPERVLVDPSAASFIAQLHRDGWQSVRGADNAVEDGLRDVASLLSADRLKIHVSCQAGIDEMTGYVWSKKAQDRGEDKPLKERDHFCLVAGSAVTTLLRGDVPIEDVRCGDRVLTRSGWHPVLASLRTARNVETVTVATTGRSLTGTPDHPVWTVERGWQRMDALRYGDTLLSCDPRSSSSTASSSGATRNRPAGPTGSTSRRARATASAAWAAFTRNCGSPLTVRSRTAATSTTPTSTPSTTRSTTSSASPRTSTLRRTTSAWWSAARRTLRRLWPWSGQPSGIAALKVRRGTSTTASEPGTVDNLGMPPVSSAAPRTSRSIPAGSARTAARAHGAGLPASTTSSGHASAAPIPSSPTATTRPGSVVVRVVSVTPAGRADVFNLAVDGAHEFFANGVLVHNCDALRYGVRGTRTVWRHWIGETGLRAA